jgi:Mg/Co/Ni transporter MgtE
MNELQELREKIEKQDYQGALLIVNELEEMSVEDKLNKIYSYVVILLVHLIKQEAENRTTSSWNRSIYNSIKYINKTNKKRRSGGYYASDEVLNEIIDEAYDHALSEASFEAFEGKMSPAELGEKTNLQKIKQKAFALIKSQ